MKIFLLSGMSVGFIGTFVGCCLGLAFSLNALILIKVSIIDGVTGLPYPPFIILVIFAIASFYVSKKASD